MASTTNTAEQRSLLHGMVKWFDQKKGFGFITVVDGSQEHLNTDIFVHHTDIVVQKARYKNLYQGEYVSFYLNTTEDQAHPVKAGEVMGAFRGLLRADTRIINSSTRRTGDDSQDRTRSSQGRGGGGRGRGRGRGGGRGGGRTRNTRGDTGRTTGPSHTRRSGSSPIDLTPVEDEGEFNVEE